MYKKLFHFLLLCLMLTGVVGGDNLNFTQQHPHSDDPFMKLALDPQYNSLSAEDTEVFIGVIRSDLRDLGFEKWQNIPVLISDIIGAHTASFNDGYGVFVGSGLYREPWSKWLKAILGHELIHIEKDHMTTRKTWNYVFDSVFMLSLIMPYLSVAYQKFFNKNHTAISKYPNSNYPAVRLWVNTFMREFVLAPVKFLGFLFALGFINKQQEKEADIVSATRWNTAQDLIEFFEYKEQGFSQFLEEHVHKASGNNPYASMFIGTLTSMANLFSYHPSEADRIAYLKPIAEKQEQGK
jgi:Peptidase family M48